MAQIGIMLEVTETLHHGTTFRRYCNGWCPHCGRYQEECTCDGVDDRCPDCDQLWSDHAYTYGFCPFQEDTNKEIRYGGTWTKW
jgi:hypothetical protein